MHESLLADIGKAIIGAGIIGLPSYLLGIPLILAYLIAGVILGPHLGLSLIKDTNSISNISEIGLVLLMFILGLEINLKKLLQTGRAVLLSGFIQIIGSFLLGLLTFYILGYSSNDYTLIYIAVACALSSTLIVVKILSDQMDLDSLPSRITLGILVLQDLFAIGFLALQPSLSDLNSQVLLFSLFKVIILVFTSWFIAKFILPTIFKKAGLQPELMLILAMAWCFGICGIANFLHLSVAMGSLIAGISIATFPYRLDIAAKISSLRDFFITLFFVSLGLQIPKPSIDVLILTFVIIIFVNVSRLITIYPILHKLGLANRASLLPTINLSQLSEFSLVLAALGISYQHISSDLLSAFILAMAGSALISSFMIPSAHSLYKYLNPYLEKIGFHDHISKHLKSIESSKSPPIVILGFYREASSLLFEIKEKYSEDYLKQILVVDFNPEVHLELIKMKIPCQYGDISNADTLRHLHLQHAQMIICSIPDKILKGTTNLKMLLLLRKLAPESKIIVTAENIQYANQLYREGASYVFIPRIISSTYLLEIIERLQSNETSLRDEAKKFIKERREIIP